MSDYAKATPGTVTNAALLIETDGNLHQVHIPFAQLIQLVRVAESMGGGALKIGRPIEYITLDNPNP